MDTSFSSTYAVYVWKSEEKKERKEHMPDTAKVPDAANKMIAAMEWSVAHGWKPGPHDTFMSKDDKDGRDVRLNFRDNVVLRMDKRVPATEEDLKKNPRRRTKWVELARKPYVQLTLDGDKLDLSNPEPKKPKAKPAVTEVGKEE